MYSQNNGARRSPSPSYSPPRGYRTNRRRSPSYSPPRRATRRSPSYSPPRGVYNRGGNGSRFTDDFTGIEKGRGSFKRTRSRSQSPRPKNEYSRSPDSWKRRKERSSSRDRKYSPPERQIFTFDDDDEEARRTFQCKHCDVKLHDRDSIESHLQGKPHLMQQQRLKDHALRVGTGFGIKARTAGTGKVEYDSSFRQRERGPKNLKPEQKRWLDEKGLDKIEPKFKLNTYDKGQFDTGNPDFHCEPCGVWVKQRDQMQAHKEGKNHKKKCEKVIRHHCEICLIDVTCKETLENHKQGKDHVKREKQLEMSRRRMRERENDTTGDEVEVYGGEAEHNETFEEMRKKNRELEQRIKILQSEMKKLQEHKKRCLDTHETEDFKELLEFKKRCINEHQRPKELQKPGLHCKQEREQSPNQPSTSHSGFKSEKRRSYHESNSDEEQNRRSYKSEMRSPDGRRGRSPEARRGRSPEARRGRSPEGRRDGRERRQWDVKREVKSERRSDEVGRERRSDEGSSWHTPAVDNKTRDEQQEYMEDEVKLKAEDENDERNEYLEKEGNLKSEASANETDDDIMIVE